MTLKYHHSLKKCGKYHAFCKVCRPGLWKSRKQTPPRTLTADETAVKYAAGYKPHPTKTMWTRHAERYNIPFAPRVTTNNRTLETLPPFDGVIAEVEAGRDFTNAELRGYFGFDNPMLRRFRANVKAERVFAAKTQAERMKMHKAAAERQARDEKILHLRLDKRLTLDAIGENIGLTRERVRQILVGLEKKYGITVPRNVMMTEEELRASRILVAVRCRICGKIREATEASTQKWLTGFCDEHKMSKLDYSRVQQDPAYLTMDDTARARWIYKHDAARRAQLKKSQRRYAAKLKADPVRNAARKAKESEYHRMWYMRKETERVKKQIRPFVAPTED